MHLLNVASTFLARLWTFNIIIIIFKYNFELQYNNKTKNIEHHYNYIFSEEI